MFKGAQFVTHPVALWTLQKKTKVVIYSNDSLNIYTLREASLFMCQGGQHFCGRARKTGVAVQGGQKKLPSTFRGGKKKFYIFLFQSQYHRYILGFNRHVHSTLIMWLYSGYIVFIHDNIVQYCMSLVNVCRAEVYVLPF